MLTRCPHIACFHEFEVAELRFARCPKCVREFTVRPLDVWKHVEKQAATLQDTGRLVTHDTIADAVANATAPVLAIVEDIRSLFNVGSMLRTADGAGITDVILTGISGTPPRKEIAKTSLGAEESVNWLYAPTSLELLPGLREAGYTLLALEFMQDHPGLPDSVPLSEVISAGKLKNRVCLLVGNEVTGVTRESLAVCDVLAHLPMRGVKESLNVAVAFGVAAYMLCDALPA